MWINLNNNSIIKSPKEIEVGGIKYPKQIWQDKAFLASIGIKPYREVKNDSRYYFDGAKTVTDNGDEVVATYEPIARDVEMLKTGMLSKVKQEQANKLQAIDWYWLREMKTGIAVPQAVKDEADAIYLDAATKETAIANLVTIDDIIAYDNQQVGV